MNAGAKFQSLFSMKYFAIPTFDQTISFQCKFVEFIFIKVQRNSAIPVKIVVVIDSHVNAITFSPSLQVELIIFNSYDNHNHSHNGLYGYGPSHIDSWVH